MTRSSLTWSRSLSLDAALAHLVKLTLRTRTISRTSSPTEDVVLLGALAPDELALPGALAHLVELMLRTRTISRTSSPTEDAVLAHLVALALPGRARSPWMRPSLTWSGSLSLDAVLAHLVELMLRTGTTS